MSDETRARLAAAVAALRDTEEAQRRAVEAALAARDDAMRAARAEGAALAEIAKITGLTPLWVSKRSTPGGIPRPPLDDEQVRAMMRKGLTPGEMARRLGRDINMLRRAVGRLDPSYPNPAKQPKVKVDGEQIRALRAEGLTRRQIAERVGLSMATVSRHWT